VSLGIVIKGPEGLVLAAESRVTLEARAVQGQASQPITVNFDNATKLLTFTSRRHRWVGAVTYGQAAIGLRTAHSFLPELESELPQDERLSIQDFAQRLSTFYQRQFQEAFPQGYSGPNMTFVVGGFNEGEPYGRVYVFDLPQRPVPTEQQVNPGDFGLTWGGQREVVDRLIRGYDHRLIEIASQIGISQPQIQQLQLASQPLQMAIPLAAMPLQDCVDLAIFFIRTTIAAQHLTVGIRGCGGPIDVAVVTRRDGLKFVQRKEVAGENVQLSRIQQGSKLE
jgi:hypothetical protein